MYSFDTTDDKFRPCFFQSHHSPALGDNSKQNCQQCMELFTLIAPRLLVRCKLIVVINFDDVHNVPFPRHNMHTNVPIVFNIVNLLPAVLQWNKLFLKGYQRGCINRIKPSCILHLRMPFFNCSLNLKSETHSYKDLVDVI